MRNPTVTRPPRLTTGRLAALVIGIPISLAVIAWSALTLVALLSLDSFQVHRSFTPSASQLSVTVDSGDLTLIASGDSQVHLTGIAHYGLVRPTVDVTTTGASVSVTVHCPWFVAGECSVDLTVAIPPRIEVTASTDTGNLTSNGLDDLSLQTDTGDLQVDGGSGFLHLSSQTGDITGVAIDAPRVTTNAQTGNISLDFAQAPTNVSAQDQTGDVTVTLPAGGTPYAVSAHTQTGDTNVEVPTNPASTNEISASTATGDVTVESAG
jgi:hypothetical protein